MRSEHRNTADEVDINARYWDPSRGRWVYWYPHVGRAGVRKAVKRRSHRIDRQRAKIRAAAEALLRIQGE